MAHALIGTGTEGGEGLTVDVLMVALARHVGLHMSGVSHRRDDAWLHPSALRRIVDRIDGDPAMPPTLSELAGLAGLGPSAFIRAFRGATGQTPGSFSRERRLAAARQSLLASEASLEAIANDHGFSSKAHFITTFRRRYDVPPGRLRTESRATAVGAFGK